MNRSLWVVPWFILFASPAVAAEPQKWVLESFQDFLGGEVESVEITEDGELRLGREVRRIAELKLPQVWAASVDSKTQTVYLSGGDQGEVWRIGADGSTSLIHKSSEPFVYALALVQGELWVGSSPDGKIVRVPLGKGEKAEGKAGFDPVESYIWSIRTTSEGIVWVGTGTPAKVYRLTPKGDSQLVFESKEDHVSTLVPQSDGSVIVGCSGPGRIYRVPAKGKRTVLLDSDREEVRALVQDAKGSLYAALVGLRSGAAGGPKTASSGSAANADDAEDILGEPSPTETRRWSAGAKSSPKKHQVVRIDADGFVFPIWDGDDTPFALAAAPSAAIPGASGTASRPSAADSEAVLGLGGGKARLLGMSGPDFSKSLIFQGPEEEVVAVLPQEAGGWSVITSHGSAVYRVGGDPASKGAYYSEAFDAQRVSYWGKVEWRTRPHRVDKGLKFWVRGGNTEHPGEDWSDWTLLKNGQPSLDPTRFFQWKVEFEKSKEPVSVLQVRANFLTKNAPPEVQGLSVKEVQPARAARAQAGGGAPSSGAAGAPAQGFTQVLQPGMPPQPEAAKINFLDLSWKASDPDGDSLTYDLFMRGQEESAWKEIQKDWTRPTYRWDISVVPDGVYFVKIVARDRASNPRDQALAGEVMSSPIEIDNTPPEIRSLKHAVGPEGVRIEFETVDRTTAVDAAEVALDSQEWELVYPVDRIADSSAEKFEVTLPVPGQGEHTVVIKVKDRKENTLTEKLVFSK